jgi:CRP-like cAMP-binding protein
MNDLSRRIQEIAATDLITIDLNRNKLTEFEFLPSQIEVMSLHHQNLQRICKIPSARRTEQHIGDLIMALRKFSLFASHENRLNTREKVHLAMSLGFEEYKEFEPVCRIKEPPSFVFFVLSGEIAITLANPAKFTLEKLKGTVITKYEQGTSFGEVGIISNTTR